MIKLDNFIGDFKLFKTKPNSIKNGFLYIKEFYIDGLYFQSKRNIRVYLPKNYFLDSCIYKYSVCYFLDGQNMVDKFTSAYGEWNLDETISKLKNKHIILVGIDSIIDKDERKRMLEYFPSIYGMKSNIKKKINDLKTPPHGELLADFIVNKLKPIIDKTFNVCSDKMHTCIAGSSMGGLEAFYIYEEYRNYFGSCLSFSPAFYLCDDKTLFSHLFSFSSLGKIYFYCGGLGLEKKLFPLTFKLHKYLLKNGLEANRNVLVYDSSKPHHESAWEAYSFDALTFLIEE